MTLRRFLIALTTFVLSTAPAFALQPPAGQSEFVPVDSVPLTDQLPAAPLLIGAYSVVLLALFFYVLSVARRLNTVQREVQRLETDIKRGGRG